MPSTLTEPLPVEPMTSRTVPDPGCDADPYRLPDSGRDCDAAGLDASPPLAPWRLPLAQLLDSAAPTGTFSHSFGMETAIVAGEVCDAESVAEWLRCYLATSLEYNDALAIRLAEAGVAPLDGDQGGDGPIDQLEDAAVRLCELSALLEASTMAREARRATIAIGHRMMEISGDFGVPLVAAFADRATANGVHPHPALVAASVGCGLGAAWPEVCGLYLYSCLTSLVQNAVRAIPLGQIAGQQVLAGLAGPVATTVRRTARADPEDLGSSSPMLDVLQCEHETQLGRMFIS